MILNNFPTDSDQHVPRKTGELLKRYLSEERGYHVDLLQVLRQLSAGALTPALQSAIAELHQRRQSITSLKVEILDRHAAERGRSGRDPTLSEIAYDFDATTQFDVQTQTQDVRRLIIQTRIAADRLGSRLSLMHQCLEEILTGKPSTKTTSYNREGRLQSLPSNRSLLTRRAPREGNMQLHEIGLSALRASQKGLEVSGQNITNASTPGYHRQRVELAARISSARTALSVGSGVDVTGITRLRALYAEQRITSSLTELSHSQASQDVLQNLEQLFPISETSLHGRLGSFFDNWNALQSSPDDPTLRRSALSSAADLAGEFNNVKNGLQETLAAVDDSIQREVERLNQLTSNLASIEKQVRENDARGVTANELLDQRDLVLQEISGIVDVRVVERGAKRDVWLAGGLIQVSTIAPQLEPSYSADGVSVVIAGTNETVPITRGSLGAMIEFRNNTIPQLSQDLADFGRLLTRSINQTIATGVDSLGGGLASLRSTLSVSDSTLPLSQVLGDDAAPAGELWINTIDETTGETTPHSISIDPDVDSLDDVASRIDLIPGLHARVDSSGRLLIDSDAGVRFDFSGRVDPSPSSALITGTSAVQVVGEYTGSGNDLWTATVTAGGNVGQTSGLQIEVRDGGGQLIKTIDAGLGYEAGQPIPIADGISIQLTPGSLNLGDEFSIQVVGNPDESQWLSTLGLGGLFSLETPGEITIRSELLKSPELLRLSKTGDAADGGIAQDVYALRQLFEFQGLKPEQYLADVTARIGGEVVAEEILTQGLENELILLEEEQSAVVGVDTNEEFVRLLEYQRGFQAGSRFLQTVEESLDEVLRLIR